MITLGVYLFGGLLSALTLGHSQGWVYWLWVIAFHRRYGNRRRIRGDQLRHR